MWDCTLFCVHCIVTDCEVSAVFLLNLQVNVNSCSIFEPKRSEMKSRMDDVTKRGVWLVLLAMNCWLRHQQCLITCFC
jgi:hypothetical protein